MSDLKWFISKPDRVVLVPHRFKMRVEAIGSSRWLIYSAGMLQEHLKYTLRGITVMAEQSFFPTVDIGVLMGNCVIFRYDSCKK